MIRCVFEGHAHRRDICQGEAQSFFRTAKGTLWPLCQPCAERHKEMILQIATDGTLNVETAVFDIPIDDPDAVQAWKEQGPEKIQKVIQAVDQLNR